MRIRISVPVATLRSPEDSAETTVGFEDAVLCEGSNCGATHVSEDGELELLPPHSHLIVRGRSPEAGPRRYPIWR